MLSTIHGEGFVRSLSLIDDLVMTLNTFYVIIYHASILG